MGLKDQIDAFFVYKIEMILKNLGNLISIQKYILVHIEIQVSNNKPYRF